MSISILNTNLVAQYNHGDNTIQLQNNGNETHYINQSSQTAGQSGHASPRITSFE